MSLPNGWIDQFMAIAFSCRMNQDFCSSPLGGIIALT
ncbi:hypothetical protein SPLC1_S590300 [Arthrospira platensis C1]|nr:hypothetical protein SPLC1_S590300 [Arthrospira platensis C1]